MLTNGGFHNIGTASNSEGELDSGRAFGTDMALLAEFNCRSEYNDSPSKECPHLDYLKSGEHDGKSFGAFKVPTLRGLNKSGPYMHDERFDSLDAVIDFYASDQLRTAGAQSELPMFADFTDSEKQQLTDFLSTLGSSLDTHPLWLETPKA